MLRPCLTKPSYVAAYTEITGHSNLLSASYTHSIDTANDWLLAFQNSTHHVIKQAHILPVFLGISCIILGIFLGIAAGTKGFVANTGKYYGHNTSIVRSLTKCKDNFLDCTGSITVILLRIVKPYPGIENPFDRCTGMI